MAVYQAKDDFYERRSTDGFSKEENYEILEAGMANNAGTQGDAVYDMEKALRLGELFVIGALITCPEDLNEQTLLRSSETLVCVSLLMQKKVNPILYSPWKLLLSRNLNNFYRTNSFLRILH